MYEYSATCVRVVDGDTLDLNIDLGLKIHVHERVRLHGINTPEIHGVKKGSDEYERGMAAKEFVQLALFTGREYLSDGVVQYVGSRNLIIETVKDTKGKYGRYLAIVHVDGKCLNDWLVEEGHAEQVSY